MISNVVIREVTAIAVEATAVVASKLTTAEMALAIQIVMVVLGVPRALVIITVIMDLCHYCVYPLRESAGGN